MEAPHAVEPQPPPSVEPHILARPADRPPVPPPKQCFILRGLPGSGKSTLARTLLSSSPGSSPQGAVLSTDDFFRNPTTGAYDFSTSALPKAHYWNQLRSQQLMEQGVPLLVIDNCNLQPWEAAPYVRAAREHGYQVELLEPDTPWARDPAELARRNTHGLDAEAVAKLAGRLEAYTLKDALAALPPPHYQLDDKDRRRVQASLLGPLAPAAPPPAPAPVASLRLEVARNDGQKSVLKPIVVRAGAARELADVARLACQSLKLKPGPRGWRLFTLRGEELVRLDELAPGMQLVVSDNGQDFVPIALRKTAAERRADKVRRAQEETAAALGHDEAPPAAAPGPRAPSSVAPRDLARLPLGASEVGAVPGLFIGSGRDAHTEAELRRHAISHVLNAAAADFPSTRLAGLAAVRELPLQDVAEQALRPHLPAAFAFIESALAAGGRVLVHCAVGRSRSVAVVLAYLVARRRLRLRDACAAVRAARPQMCPNGGFMRQLMGLERRELGACSLTWDEVETGCASVLAWLEAHAAPARGLRAEAATHMWWDVLSKQRFVVPAARRPELLAECARQRMRRPAEPLRLVELRQPACGWRLHADIDLRAARPAGPLEAVLAALLPLLAAAVQRLYPAAAPSHVVATGCAGPSASASRPEVAYKYGLHLVWPGVRLASAAEHRRALAALVDALRAAERDGLFPASLPLADVRAHNEWDELVDCALPDSDCGLRLLYSAKAFSCRACARKEHAPAASKRKTKEKEQKARAAGAARVPCAHCGDTGMLPARVHAFLGVFTASGAALDAPAMAALAPEDSVAGVRQRLELASILPADQESADEREEEQQQADEGGEGAAEYSAVVLDLADQVRLLQAVPPPPDWAPRADHMTLCLGPLAPATGLALGDRVALQPLALGRHPRALALRVGAPDGRPPLPCLSSAVPHVTVAVAPHAAAAEANAIQDWQPLPPAAAAALAGPLWGTVRHCARRAPMVLASASSTPSPSPSPSPLALPEPLPAPPAPADLSRLTRRGPAGKQGRRELAVVEFLRAHGEEALTKGRHVRAAHHGRHRQLVQFSYGQAACDFADPVVRECRGIVLDSKDGWRPVALPYAKFFNAGEPHAPALDWASATVYEKLDGALAILYYYADEWHVASSAVPDGSGAVAKNLTFADLFWQAWRAASYRLPGDTRLTYLFELLSPHCPVVVRPQRDAVILHGARDSLTYEELLPEEVAAAHGWACAPRFGLRSLEEVLATARRLNPAEHEGYVVVDGAGQRLKVKAPQYVALAHLHVAGKLAVNARHMLQIVRTNEGAEFLVHFPEHALLHAHVKAAYDALVARLQALYDREPREGEKEADDDEDEQDENHQEDGAALRALVVEAQAANPPDLRSFLVDVELDRLFRLLPPALREGAAREQHPGTGPTAAASLGKAERRAKKKQAERQRRPKGIQQDEP